MLLFNVLVLLAAAATASAPTTGPVNITPLLSTTERGPKCTIMADTPPRCANGLFCGKDLFCYQQHAIGQSGAGDWQECANPGYCKIDSAKKEPGVCALRKRMREACGGHTNDQCAENLSCLLPEGKDSDAVGKCVVLPRSMGDACNHDNDCGKSGFCKKANEDLRLGACAQRAKLSRECSGLYGSRTAPLCDADLACFVKEEGEKGVCMKNNGGAGTKCSFFGGLFCAYNQNVYCKTAVGKTYGDCVPESRLGQKCVFHTEGFVPCAEGLSCYYEDDDRNGLCMKTFGNPLGSKCSWNVSCVEGAECHTAAGKKYGTCQKKVAGQ